MNPRPPAAGTAALLETDVPRRLERLPWGRFHTLVIVALGITWILDGLEVTLAGSLAGALEHSSLRLTATEVGFAGSAYLAGAVLGSVLFGWATDRLGRKKLFFITLALYLLSTGATAFSWNATSFFALRFLTGAGIGGEYTAIASTIQELVPARYRGWTDLVVNGTFWIGAALGAAGSIVFLDPAMFAPDIGWRAAFLTGAVIGLVILLMRLWIPESPRWLVIHGRGEEARRIVEGIEHRFTARGTRLPEAKGPSMRIIARDHTPLDEVLRTLIHKYRGRTLVALALMIAQAFFYNAIFFTYALVLTRFYGVPGSQVGWYILPFAAGNVLGPVLLGRFFDTVGRRRMIALTYGVSGLLLAVTGALFASGAIGAVEQTLAWSVIFFFASPAASAAYLTVSESFPLEVRALAIALFYAVGTGIGGIAAPVIFGALIASGSRESVFIGYLAGSALMIGAALLALKFATPAERRPLEDVAAPLSQG